MIPLDPVNLLVGSGVDGACTCTCYTICWCAPHVYMLAWENYGNQFRVNEDGLVMDGIGS